MNWIMRFFVKIIIMGILLVTLGYFGLRNVGIENPMAFVLGWGK